MECTSAVAQPTIYSEYESWLRNEKVPLAIPAGISPANATKKKKELLDKFIKEHDPVQYWQHEDMKAKYPNLRIIALAKLSVAPSSAGAERDFSASGLLLSDLRGALSPGLVDAMVMVHRNMGKGVVPESVGDCMELTWQAAKALQKQREENYFTQEDEAMYAAAAALYKKRADEKKKKGKKKRGAKRS